MLTEEEQWKVGRPTRETIVMDMETDNTNVPRNEDSDLQLDTGKEDGPQESGLSNMDRENTRKPGAEMETALPRGLDEPSGDQYLQTGTDPIHGEKMGGQPDAVGDANMTTDSAPSWYNKKLNPRIDSGDSEEGIEQQDGTEVGILQGNEAGTTTRSRKRQISVKDLGDTEASGQLQRDIRTGDHANGVAIHMQDETGGIEHLTEESEGRGHGTATTTENSGQNTKDAPEATTREQAVKEQEAGESETPLEAERGKNTATGGVHENRDPETKEDRHTKTSSDERRRKSNDVGQGAQPLAPVEIAKNIAERNYVNKTLALLSPPKYDQFTNIVSAYDVVITREDLPRLQTDTKLNDGNIDWILRWWGGQVNGSFGKKPSPPQSNPQLPRCYFASTYWYARMTSDGVFSHDNVKNWTAKFEILQQYDLMIIPIHVPARDHWILAVIDFKKKKTTIYDSIEQDITRPPHPEIHAHLMTWMTQEHQARNIPFDVNEWEAIRGQQTPQQGYGKDVGVDCGVFVIAYTMYLSTNRPFGFSQADMSSLLNWIEQTMIGYGIGNNTFDPMKDADALETNSSSMNRWTLLVKDCDICPTGSKRKGGWVEPAPRTKLTKASPNVPPPVTISTARGRQARKHKSSGMRDTSPTAVQTWQPPLDALTRGIRNMGCSCSTGTVVALQLCFHIAPLTRILQEPLPQPAAFLVETLHRYTTGKGTLDLQDLIPMPNTSKPEDAGELLSQFLLQIRVAKPGYKLPTTLSLLPAKTLLLSLRTTVFTSPSSRAEGDSNTIIFQIDRATLTGNKNTTGMQFPLKLERECQVIARCGSKGTEYELQEVVVHLVDSKKGHYITYLKPAGGPHWALFDDNIVKWVQEKEVLDQEATILVYTRPDSVVETEPITIPDDGQEDRGPREMGDSGSVTATTGNNIPGKAVRESADTRQSSAPSNRLETRDHSLYRELLERAFQDPVTEESDLVKVMPGPPNRDQQLQEEAKQKLETRVFQDHLQEHGLREEEVEAFGNCLFLSIVRHVTKQADMYSTETPKDLETRYKTTAITIRKLALDHMLEHRLSFENSFGKKTSTLMVNDQIAADNGTDSMMEEVPAPEMERDALDSALDLDLDSYCGRMRSETAQGDELTIRAAAWALQINIRILKLNS